MLIINGFTTQEEQFFVTITTVYVTEYPRYQQNLNFMHLYEKYHTATPKVWLSHSKLVRACTWTFRYTAMFCYGTLSHMDTA